MHSIILTKQTPLNYKILKMQKEGQN